MRYIEHSHRHADAIIAADDRLKERYTQLTGAIESISEKELILDYLEKKADRTLRQSSFKSMTPSINSLLKNKMLAIDGWEAEVDIFNDDSGLIGNTEWRLDFACDDALCVEVAFNHGEAIAWNLLKPVLACELNHVKKAVQGQVGVYICATDKMKTASNIDSASGSFEKVLRYLPPMMDQLTIPIMIIGLEPFESFKINGNREIVKADSFVFDDTLRDKKVQLTLRPDYSMLKGTVMDILVDNGEEKVIIEGPRKSIQSFDRRMIRFLELV